MDQYVVDHLPVRMLAATIIHLLIVIRVFILIFLLHVRHVAAGTTHLSSVETDLGSGDELTFAGHDASSSVTKLRTNGCDARRDANHSKTVAITHCLIRL